MKRACKLTIGMLGLLVLGVVLTAGDACAQTTKDLAGTWTLVSAVTEQGGNKTDPYGPNPKGIFMVDANDRCVVVYARADLPKVASNNRTTATPEENKAIVGGSLAYVGTVSVNPAEKTLTLNIEASTFPNWNGTALKVPFTITGDELTFTAGAAAASGGGTITIVWKRAT
jgi:hypothetical protein